MMPIKEEIASDIINEIHYCLSELICDMETCSCRLQHATTIEEIARIRQEGLDAWQTNMPSSPRPELTSPE